MAEKEATVFIVDVGSSMSKLRHGRHESDLDWAMRYVATGRKTATVGVLGLRTDGTSNELGAEESFENISVLQPISQILMPNLRDLRDRIKPSRTDDGDAISALIIAIQMITTYCRKLKYQRRIVLITNGECIMEANDLAAIIEKIKEDGIELTILGPDFDDPRFGMKEEDKSPTKAENEAIFQQLAEDCDGIMGTLAQAISELELPRTKPVRPVPSFRGQLTLGNPALYDSAMCIDVERYPRTKTAAAPSASQFVVRMDSGGDAASEQSSMTLDAASPTLPLEALSSGGGKLASVKNTRTYLVEDETASGGKREVPRDDLAKGYEYGRTAVHISESDENVTKLETHAGLELLGFVPQEKYDRYMNLSVSSIIVAPKTNGKASMALSSLVHALYELESYAIAKLVTKADVAPILLLLAPSIEPDYECLLDVQLPFAEDVRAYRFPPLDRVVTVSGKVLSEHRNLPTDRLKKAMSDFVDRMDLMTFGRGDDEQPVEYVAMQDTFSPVLHRIDQAVRWRAIHQATTVPPPTEILTRYSKPPPELVERNQIQLDELRAAADVKKVPPKVKGRKRNREQTKPLSGLNVEELLGRQKRTKISAENAIPEFKQMLTTSEDPNAISDASKQMADIVRSQIQHSLGDHAYGRVIEELHVMREELIAMEEPETYNDFMKDLKWKLLAGDLGGDRRELWWEIRKGRLGLIDHGLSDLSDVTEEEANRFLSTKEP
ncbi:MAG: ATP-dependent DNA helicase II subunit 2 [Thelocarpon superellum]|nr:MAG: ATP-dependent DNA helicase II subunit 2 [Thelocarpon superellum]